MTRKTAYNSTFAIGGVSCSAENLVQVEDFVLRINICGKNPAHRKSANRYLPPPKTPHSKRNTANYFIQLPTKLHHFQAHRKRAKRQQHFCEELERFLYSALLMHLNTQYFKKQNIFTNFAPMKLFWLIFSFYILALAAIPCCESDKCVKEINTTISQNPNHNQHEHQSELCTPFCSCALCPASAFYETINLIKFRERNISFEREIQVSLYSFIYTKEFSSTIWQPPKLG